MTGDLKKLWGMFWAFFKIGSFTIGGGLAMLPLIQREFVTARGWVDEEEMLDILAIVQSVPGVIAINTSIFIGYRLAGIVGACTAVLGVTLPSFVSILAIAIAITGFQDNAYVQKAFSGVRAGVTALILAAVLKIGKSVLKSGRKIVVAAASFIAVVVLNIHTAWIILAAVIAGIFIGIVRKVKNV